MSRLAVKHQIVTKMVLITIFAFGYSTFYLSEHRLFNSPDETANYFFAQEFSKHNQLSAPLDFTGLGSDFIAPRSTRVIDGYLVPASFWGLIIIYGLIGKIFIGPVFWFILGLIGAVGVWGGYQLLRSIFGEQIALVSAFAWAIFPAWFYYASFSLFPNVLLLTLFIWSLVIWQHYLRTKNIIWLLTSVSLTVICLAVRLADLPWISIVWLATLLVSGKQQLSKKTFYAGIIFLSLGLGGLFLINKIFFGQPLTGGYVLAGPPGDSLLFSLFPAGIHPRLALNNFYQYYWQLFWFVSLPALFGGGWLIFRWSKISLQQKYYLLATVAVTGWLVVYYGSWQLADNINPTEISLGVSYVRYWLPIYLLSLPLAVYAGRSGLASLSSKSMRLFGLILIGGGYIFLSGQLILTAKSDSLLPVYSSLQKNMADKVAVLAITPRQAIIVSYRQDKVFFPERAVIQTLNNPAALEAVADLAGTYKVYWYSFFEQEDFEQLIRQPLAERGWQLRELAVLPTGTLWEVVK